MIHVDSGELKVTDRQKAVPHRYESHQMSRNLAWSMDNLFHAITRRCDVGSDESGQEFQRFADPATWGGRPVLSDAWRSYLIATLREKARELIDFDCCSPDQAAIQLVIYSGTYLDKQVALLLVRSVIEFHR